MRHGRSQPRFVKLKIWTYWWVLGFCAPYRGLRVFLKGMIEQRLGSGLAGNEDPLGVVRAALEAPEEAADDGF